MTDSQIETLDAQTSTLSVSLDIDLYPRDVLYAAAYVFLDRAYVLLDQTGTRFLVHLRGKQPMEEATLRALAGEFENELLAQALRHRVVKTNLKIIEEITTLAISGAAGGGNLTDDVSDEPAGSGDSAGTDFPDAIDDGRDFLDDPLHIAAPWEDKGKDA
jgi:His-Xaa-Ser system protein HxsD